MSMALLIKYFGFQNEEQKIPFVFGKKTQTIREIPQFSDVQVPYPTALKIVQALGFKEVEEILIKKDPLASTHDFSLDDDQVNKISEFLKDYHFLKGTR